MEVEVKVTAKDGRPVPDLKPENFTLLENGEPQTIRTFEYVDEPAADTVVQAQTPRLGPQDPTRPNQTTFQETLPRGTTWVYITGQVYPEHRKRVWRQMNEFLDESLRPGVLVSVEGSKFTSKRPAIEDALRKRIEHGGTPGSLADLEQAPFASRFRDIEYDPAYQTRIDNANDAFADLERLRINYFGTFFLYRYIELAKSLGTLPGKKVVILLTPSALGGMENKDVMRRLIGQAVRSRVAFHVVETPRLGTQNPYLPDATFAGYTSVRGAIHSPDTNRPVINLGLPPSMLSNPTGGKSAKNVLGLGRVLTAAADSLRGYYLLGYAPSDPDAEKQERKIRIEVNRSDVKLDFRKSYFEDTPFDRLFSTEKRIDLIHYVKYDVAFTDIPLTLAYDFFRGDDGKAALYASLGIHSGHLPVRPKKKSKLRFTLLAQARDVAGKQAPTILGHDIRLQASAGYIENFQQDPAAVLHVPIKMDLTPGDYEWKIVLRDEYTGDIGTYKTTLRLPDFSGTEQSSSLLLTGCFAVPPAVSAKRDSAPLPEAQDGIGGVLADGRRFYIDSSHTYQKGDPLYLLYDLYEVQAQDEKALPATRLMLLKDEEQIDPPEVTVYQHEWHPEQSQVRYLLALDSKNLDPGDYRLLALLPGDQRAIYRNFTVVADKHPDLWLDPQYALTTCRR
ncbi:MAG TPA: VWA domain-containing protein [Bryobacterales bacterium]|nr:VWA domain-containing protein [Bryobacterales bacterium]